MRRLSLVLLLLVLGALPQSAAAGPGVLEINQTCASSTGCFPGDAPGFPVTITNRGSYALTSNLHAFGEDTHGIRIENDNVTVDLQGFEIRCSRPLLVIGGDRPLCETVSGGGQAVSVDQPLARQGIEIKNGSIIGSSFGIYVGFNSVVRNLRIRSIRNFAIVAGPGTLIEGNVVTDSNVGLSPVGAAYRNNVFYGNATHIDPPGGGINLGGNACGNQVCPP